MGLLRFSLFFQLAAAAAVGLTPLYWSQTLGFNDAEIGRISAWATMLAVVAPLIFAKLANLFRLQLLIRWCFYFAGIGGLAHLASSSFGMQVVAYGLFRVGQVGTWILVPVAVLHFFGDRVGTEYGRYRWIGSVAYVLSYLLCGAVTTYFGNEPLFFILAITCFLAAVPFFNQVKVPAQPERGSVRAVFQNKLVRWLLVGTVLIDTQYAILLIYLPLRAVELGANNFEVAAIIALQGLLAALTMFRTGRHSDNVSIVWMFRIVALATALRFSLLYLPEQHFYWLFAIQLLHVPSWVFQDVARMKLLHGFVANQNRAVVQSFWFVASTLGITLGSAVGAWIIEQQDLRAVFLWSSAFPAAAALLFYVLPCFRREAAAQLTK